MFAQDSKTHISQANAGLAGLQTAIRSCVAGGKVVIVGLGSEEAKIPLSIAACKELDIIGSFRYCNTVGLGHGRIWSQ